MFTLSKTGPELTFQADTHKDLGSRLSDLGGRILLICSLNPEDRESIAKIKAQLTQSKITFIQCDQNGSFINRDDLETLQVRAENFNVSTVVSIGDIPQRMSGRFVSQRLSLHYIEIPTTLNLPYLLVPQSIFSNRIGNDYEIQNLSPERIKSIDIDSSLLRKSDSMKSSLTALSILLDLSHLFTDPENNTISANESKNLFLRLLCDLEEDKMNTEKLSIYSITAAMYHGASSDIELNISLYTFVAGYRFGFNSNLARAKILPYFLDDKNEHELSLRVRELLGKIGIILNFIFEFL